MAVTDVSVFYKNESQECSEDNLRVGHLDWCICGNCLVGKSEINRLFCFEAYNLNSKLDTENISCIIQSKELDVLCTSEILLRNVLTGLHKTTSGNHLEDDFTN